LLNKLTREINKEVIKISTKEEKQEIVDISTAIRQFSSYLTKNGIQEYENIIENKKLLSKIVIKILPNWGFNGYQFEINYLNENQLRKKELISLLDFMFGMTKNLTDKNAINNFVQFLSNMILTPQQFIEVDNFISEATINVIKKEKMKKIEGLLLSAELSQFRVIFNFSKNS
jgi:hypothetical protein